MSYDPDELKKAVSRFDDQMRRAFPPKHKPLNLRSEVTEAEDKDEALGEISELRAMIELCKNNNWACIIYINGLSIGLCNNESIIPALNEEIEERERFLRGEPSQWE